MRPEAALIVMLALATAFAGSVSAKEKKPATLSESGRADVVLSQNDLASGDLKSAEAHARSALASDGGSALPHAAMAMVWSAKKQDDKAKREFDKALALAPGDGMVLNSYGSWLCARGDREGADNAFRSALQDPRAQRFQPLVNAAQCAILGKDWKKADGYLRGAVAIAPRHRGVLLLLAETQLELGRPMDARAFVQRSDALGPDANTLALAVRVEDAAGDTVASGRYRKRLAEEFPNYLPGAEGARKQ
jgi:type IV pilus assembly protein PilF